MRRCGRKSLRGRKQTLVLASWLILPASANLCSYNTATLALVCKRCNVVCTEVSLFSQQQWLTSALLGPVPLLYKQRFVGCVRKALSKWSIAVLATLSYHVVVKFDLALSPPIFFLTITAHKRQTSVPTILLRLPTSSVQVLNEQRFVTCGQSK